MKAAPAFSISHQDPIKNGSKVRRGSGEKRDGAIF
jgi:hypothetical protein